MLDADQLLLEKLWENLSEKELEAGGGDEDDYLFGEETGDGDAATQTTLEEQVFGKDKDETVEKWEVYLRRGK